MTRSEWQVYHGRKKRGNKRNTLGASHDASSSPSSSSQLPGSQGHPVTDDIGSSLFKVVKRVNHCKLQLHPCIAFLLECVKSLKASVNIKSIVCYGLGSLEASFESQAQLALVAGLKEQLEASSQCEVKCYIFDPVLTAGEYRLVEKEYGFTPIDTDEQCSRAADEMTLFYMPHMDAHFYNGLLRCNWRPERLTNLIILGNSLRYIMDSSIEKRAKDQLDKVRIVSSLPAWREFDLLQYDQEKYESSFNQIVLEGICSLDEGTHLLFPLAPLYGSD